MVPPWAPASSAWTVAWVILNLSASMAPSASSRRSSLAREDRLEDALGAMLAERFRITHATVQAELAGAHGGTTTDNWGAAEAGHRH